MPIVAYSQAEGFTRITELKNCPFKTIRVAVEYPLQYIGDKTAEPYYPVITAGSQKQYAQYSALAKEVNNLIVCGRLGDFKYYNMDQALERVLQICQDL